MRTIPQCDGTGMCTARMTAIALLIHHSNEHREMRPKASSSVVEYPILIAYPSMYGMLKVCSVKDLLFRISSARVKSSL